MKQRKKYKDLTGKDLSTSSVLPKRIKIIINILKTNEKFRVLLTHFRSSNPKTTFLKLKLQKKNKKACLTGGNMFLKEIQ